MERRRNLKELMGIFKDKVSIIKAKLSTKQTSSLINLAVIRATNHKYSTPPPDHRLSAILSLADRSYLIQNICIDAITDRLHKTHSPYVALKCLLIIHNIVVNGFSIFKNQNHHHHQHAVIHRSLNLSSFHNDESHETIELSSWVRWYACVLESNLVTSRMIACDTRNDADDNSRVSAISSETILIKEINSLVCVVEEICKAPKSLNYQINDVVHDVMIMVGKDYRLTQHEIMSRLGELSGRHGKLSLSDSTEKLSLSDSTELLNWLRRLEQCKPRLTEIFANRMRNNEFWELISQIKMELADKGKRLLGWK